MLQNHLSFASSADLIISPFLVVLLLWLGKVDIKTYRLPDIATLPQIPLGLVLAIIRNGEMPYAHIAGALAGYGILALFGWLYFLLRKREGLGLGDAKLLGGFGAFLGIEKLPVLILIAAISALLFALLRGKQATSHLAFGPWLIGSFLLIWLAFLTGNIQL